LNKKLLMILPSVAATLAAVAVGMHARAPAPRTDNSELSASMGGASLEEGGPVPTVSSYELSSHQTLSRVILLIRENYVEPERIRPYEMFLAALDYIQRTVPEVMVDDSQAPERIKVSVGTAEQTFELGGVDQLWEVTMSLRDIFRFLQTQISDPEQRRDIEYAAINGMLSTLDPHSMLLKPESFDEVKLSTKGEFGGLGIVISIREGALTIMSPIEGTPAARAGLKAKDRIFKIGEESTVNMSLEEAVQRLRGKPGTKVTLWVQRKGWSEPRKYALARANVKIESVTSELLADSIGYVRIKNFQNNTYDDLHEHLERLRKKNKGELKGLVLDLRNNPGGLLDQAILVSDRFIDKGPIVITVGEGNRKREEKDAHFSGTERDYPMAVLVNAGSASASEIVAGALKNHDRALILGQQSFGKGSVQVLYDFKDKSALKLTIAQYLTPGDISIQGVGISPDVAVVPAAVSKDAIRLFVDDDSPHERDLEKHLDRRGESSVDPTLTEPAAKLLHLVDEPDAAPKAADDDADEAPTEGEKIAADFETKLARDILAQAKGVDRKALRAGAVQLLDKRGAEEEQRIIDRMKTFGVDWSRDPDKTVTLAKGEPSAQVELTVAGKGRAPLRAGDTAVLTATAHNTGTVPLYRVYGVSNSDNPWLKHQEFVFGRLMPGQSRVWTTEIKLPADMISRADSVSLTLADEPGRLKAVSTTSIVSIDEQPRPRFAFVAMVDDKARGNGDGVLQPGEKADLQVEVTNVGSGEAKDAVVSIKNLAGESLFLERGREKLGALKPGGSKSADLKFSVKDDAQLEAVELRLTVWDSNLGGTMTETLHVPVLAARRTEADARLLRVSSKEEAPVYAGAATSTAVVAYAQPGAILKSDAHLEGEWRRVEVTPTLVGYVREPDVKLARTGNRATLKQGLRLAPAVAAPRIELTLPALTTGDDVLRLHGTVTDATALKDVFVLVNDKKVYYRSLAAAKPGPGGDGVSAPLDITLPLKKGSNSVILVVRHDEDLMARKIFGVHRGDAAVVADAKKPESPPAEPQ
jgi:carboxyl-terminal processing protease